MKKKKQVKPEETMEKESATESISFPYDKEQKKILKAEAKKENRSLSNYLRLVLDKHIANL